MPDCPLNDIKHTAATPMSAIATTTPIPARAIPSLCFFEPAVIQLKSGAEGRLLNRKEVKGNSSHRGNGSARERSEHPHVVGHQRYHQHHEYPDKCQKKN